jgi:hypothetical protein
MRKRSVSSARGARESERTRGVPREGLVSRMCCDPRRSGCARAVSQGSPPPPGRLPDADQRGLSPAREEGRRVSSGCDGECRGLAEGAQDEPFRPKRTHADRMTQLRKSSHTARQFSPIPVDFLAIRRAFASAYVATRAHGFVVAPSLCAAFVLDALEQAMYGRCGLGVPYGAVPFRLLALGVISEADSKNFSATAVRRRPGATNRCSALNPKPVVREASAAAVRRVRRRG